MNCKDYPGLIRPKKHVLMVRRIMATLLFFTVFIVFAKAEVVLSVENSSARRIENSKVVQQQK